MILIAGDSWGGGEWDTINKKYKPYHGGLSQYINESGKKVINLSWGGSSNLFNTEILSNWFLNNKHIPIDKILIFQTDYSREYINPTFNDDFNKIKKYDSLSTISIERYYNELKKIQDETNVKIFVIGGLCDTFEENLSKEKYGINIACQSMINLIVKNKPSVEYPLFSIYHDREHLKILDKIKSKLNIEELEKLIFILDKSKDRYFKLFKDNHIYFYPDGDHANRIAHKKLYDFLVIKGIL